MTIAAATSQWLADTPASWEDPPPMSTLHALLLFVGVPALIFGVITLLVVAPSLAKGPRYRPGQEWDAQPEWLGTGESPTAAPVTRQLTAGDDADDADSGGASARW